MSVKCADQSDVSLMKRVYVPKGRCDCNCDKEGHSYTPMGFVCNKCNHIQRGDF